MLSKNIRVQRLGNGPIIKPNMDARMGSNVNGPSLIKVPEWLPNPLGHYYLYFAHHDGQYIRLAVADQLAGPWRTHEAGVLPLRDSLFLGHIASPDVIVDDSARRIRLYFHGADQPTGSGSRQFTRVARSSDGLNFTTSPEDLGRPYMRVVQYRDWHYALAMPGTLYRSRDGLRDFEEGHTPFASDMRHAALLIKDDRLFVFYTRVGDAPERILLSWIDLSAEWRDWAPSKPVTLLEPELHYEGANLPLRPSVRGLAQDPVRELRDPAVYQEGDHLYLLYSVAGEQGIAIARLDGAQVK